MSENPEEFSTDELNREVSEGSCQDGNVGSGVAWDFVSFWETFATGGVAVLPVLINTTMIL